MLIRNELASDIPAIRAVVSEAMRMLTQASGTEAAIVDRLRAEDALTMSLVAEDGGEVIGYLAASEARIGAQGGWGLIGPLVVLPSRHRQGIGKALIMEAILQLKARGRGAVLVGSPRYNGRFGFSTFQGLGVQGCPPEVVQALPFDSTEPRGEVTQHPAFSLDQ